MSVSIRKPVWDPVSIAALIAMAFIGIAATWRAWADIIAIAIVDEESSQVLLAPIVAAWMVWARRTRLRWLQPSAGVTGPIICGAGALLHWFGLDQGLQALWHGGAVLVVIGCVLSVTGPRPLFRFFPAFLALAFLVPVPGSMRQSIAIPLQTATASVTQTVFEVMGIAVERSGNLLTINGVDVAVAEACNGMRMVFALFLVSYAFAFSMPLRNATRIVIIAASPLAAIICNVLRLLPTILAYGYGSHDFAQMLHDASGWLMLPLAFAMLLAIIRVLRWALLPVGRFNLAYQ